MLRDSITTGRRKNSPIVEGVRMVQNDSEYRETILWMSTGKPHDARLREYTCILFPDDECQELSVTGRYPLNYLDILNNGDRSGDQDSSTFQRQQCQQY